MYGKDILMEAINDLLTKDINQYLDEAKLNIYGSPIPSASMNSSKISEDFTNDFEFYYDLGFLPTVEVKGIDDKPSFERYKVIITDKMVADEFTYLQEKNGEQTKITEGKIEENDFFKFKITIPSMPEYVNETDSSLLFNDIPEESKSLFIGKTFGDKVEVDPRKMDSKADEATIRKYILNLEEGQIVPDLIHAEITEITRKTPVELNEDLLKKVFGEENSTVEAATVIIKENLGKFYSERVNQVFLNTIKKHLEANNPIELPDEFIKRYLNTIDANNTIELIEKEYYKFAQNLKWSSLKSEIAKKYDLMINEQEIENYFRGMIAGYYGIDPSHQIATQFFQKSVEDEKAIEKAADEIFGNKLLQLFEEKATFTEKEITQEEFEDILMEN